LPQDIQISPVDKNTAVIALGFPAEVAVITGLTTTSPSIFSRVTIGGSDENVRGVSISPNGDMVIVTHGNPLPALHKESISILTGLKSGALKLERTLTPADGVGSAPTAIRITPDGDTALVTNPYDATVSILKGIRSGDPQKVRIIVQPQAVGGMPLGLAVLDEETALVTGYNDSTLNIFKNLIDGDTAGWPTIGFDQILEVNKLRASSAQSVAAGYVEVSFPYKAGPDFTGNGVVDKSDLQKLLDALNAPLLVKGDPRDLNGDGVINALDTRLLVIKCTKPLCAP